jgi:hypothetical protein
MNALYGNAKTLLWTAGTNWTSANLKAVLVTAAYVPNLATDQFLNVISGGDIVSSGVALTGKSINLGALSANPVVFSGVAVSAQVAMLVIYIDTGSSSTSPLVALINVATGLILTATGGNITCTFFGNVVFQQ